MKERGRHTRALTEFVDIYPTLCELCGLDLPKHLEGTSAAPLLDNPDQPWKKAAFSQYPNGKLMGYTMRTERYRYMEWRDLKTKAVKSRALYDHRLDPGENANIAEHKENADLIASLAKQLGDGYQAAKP
jgi:arylsulfatase A-like enzyme